MNMTTDKTHLSEGFPVYEANQKGYEQGVRDEREKWETAVQYNVDAETWDRIRGAIHALEKPTTKNN